MVREMELWVMEQWVKARSPYFDHRFLSLDPSLNICPWFFTDEQVTSWGTFRPDLLPSVMTFSLASIIPHSFSSLFRLGLGSFHSKTVHPMPALLHCKLFEDKSSFHSANAFSGPSQWLAYSERVMSVCWDNQNELLNYKSPHCFPVSLSKTSDWINSTIFPSQHLSLLLYLASWSKSNAQNEATSNSCFPVQLDNPHFSSTALHGGGLPNPLHYARFLQPMSLSLHLTSQRSQQHPKKDVLKRLATLEGECIPLTFPPVSTSPFLSSSPLPILQPLTNSASSALSLHIALLCNEVKLNTSLTLVPYSYLLISKVCASGNGSTSLCQHILPSHSLPPA